MEYNLGLLPNLFGFLSLILYLLTLVPGIIRTILTKYRTKKWNIFLLKKRREIGVSAFILALIHGVLIGVTRNLNFFDPAVIIKYIQGVLSFGIFTILAVTSNDYSVHKLKRNWKKIHSLTYLVIYILIWHVLDKMWGKWSVFTYISLLLLFLIVPFMLYRLFFQKKSRR
ncbi:MAG: ferric reductase-like transmembrane domain-containing protein [Patescibacteria group bacterium]